jgi:hypothetical protein
MAVPVNQAMVDFIAGDDLWEQQKPGQAEALVTVMSSVR